MDETPTDRDGVRAEASRGATLRRLALLLALAPAAGCGPSDPADPSDPPQAVLLVTLDTLRADHLPMYGYPRDTAPFLSDLADRAIVFDQAISASSQTAPSHGSMLTGLYPSQHGAIQNGIALDDSVTTLAERMRDAGYRTAAFTSVGFLRGLQRGFEEFQHFEITREDRDKPHFRRAADTVRRAIAWIDALGEDERYFVWVHLFDVHEWEAGDPVEVRHLEYVDEIAAASGLSTDDYIRFLQERHGLDYSHYRNNPRMVETHTRRYDAQIKAVDEAMSTLSEAVDRGRWRDRALWVIVADHGEGLGSHGYSGHDRFLYQEQVRVPLIMRFSDGRFPATRVGDVVRTVDLMPTITHAVLGAEDRGATAGFPPAGRSVLPLIAGDVDAARLAFSERKPVEDYDVERGWRKEELWAIRDQRYKLIFHGAADDEFYDLKDDPAELRTIRESPPSRRLLERALSEQVQRLRAARDRAGRAIDPSLVDELSRLGYGR